MIQLQIMELINKLRKRQTSLEQKYASLQRGISARSAAINVMGENQTNSFEQVKQRFARQLNDYKDQELRASNRIHDIHEDSSESQHWYDLQKNILSEYQKANEELKKYQQIISNNQAYNEQCRKEIEKEQLAMKASKEGQFQSNIERPARKFQQIENRLHKGKGVYFDEKQNRIKIRISRNGPYQNFGQNQLLEYQLIFSKEHKKFLPAGNYPKDVNKLIGYYNFHRDLAQLERELEELSHSNNYT